MAVMLWVDSYHYPIIATRKTAISHELQITLVADHD